MLVEFSVANFRSINERQTISMVAASPRDKDNHYSFESHIRPASRLLRAAAIYGPNASGKSNLSAALRFMKFFVEESANTLQEGDKIPVMPFRLSKDTRSKPSEFEIIFIQNGTRYQYGFTVDTNRVWEEWLFAVPKGGRIQHWIERTFDSTSNQYNWSINQRLKGEKSVWQKSTRQNALLLSTAVLLNSESLKEPFDWFKNILRVIDSAARLSPAFTGRMCQENGDKQKIVEFMRSGDLSIGDVVIQEREFSDEMLPHDMPEAIKQAISTDLSDQKLMSVAFGHADDEGRIQLFDITEESDGSKVLFSLSGILYDVIKHDRVVLIDELHNSLHPLLFWRLVELIANGENGTSTAQLIFTTHDTSLMKSRLLRRDQFWLIEKNSGQESILTPLSEFKPRENEALESGYLGGRYGAIPNVRQLSFNLPEKG